MSEHVADAPLRKPFAAFVQEQRSGGLHGELSDALVELVAAVQEHGKAGTLALTIKVAPNKDGSTVTVTDKMKLSLPEGERGAAIYFIDGHGNLSRRNPWQQELPLKEVTREPVREDAAEASA
jgi:hypothetical protein